MHTITNKSATVKIEPIQAYLNTLADPRDARGRQHPLTAIMNLCCVALLTGAKTPCAIARWWRNRPEDQKPAILARLGFTRPYGPSQATLYRVLAAINIDRLEAALQAWAEAQLQGDPPDKDELEGVAIDGKTLRGARKQAAELTQLLSAFSQRLGLTLSQRAVASQTNEIGQMPDLLADLRLKGCVFTMDALHTQRQTAQTIVEREGDYVMILKANQTTMYQDLEVLFSEGDVAALIADQATTLNKGHGRIERRRLQTSTAMNDFLDWPGLNQVFRIERYRTATKTGQTQHEASFGLTSLTTQQANATTMLQVVRGHWHIENRSHWVRDVTFGEDASQLRTGYLPQVMAALRNWVIGLIRLLPFRFIPEGLDYLTARPLEALELIGC